MKTFIPLLFLVVAASNGSAQGTCVIFANDVLFSTPDPTGGNRLVYDVGSPLDPATGVKLVGTQYVAELYAGADAGSLQPVTAALEAFRPQTTSAPGKWTHPVQPLTLPGCSPGATLTLQVRVWDSTLFATYEQAVNHGITGASNPFQYTVPPANDPNMADFYMEGLQAFALVPEPSFIAFSLLGLASLVLFKARQRRA